MCFHVWNLYQVHRWSTLTLSSSPSSTDFRVLLSMPSCSPRIAGAGSRHRVVPPTPLYHEHFISSSSHYKTQLGIQIDVFGLIRTEVQLECLL